MKVPLQKTNLKKILSILNLQPKEIVRTSETDFKDNNLIDILDDKDKMINAIIKYPKILQRPIIINGDKGVIGRPPENILKII